MLVGILPGIGTYNGSALINEITIWVQQVCHWRGLPQQKKWLLRTVIPYFFLVFFIFPPAKHLAMFCHIAIIVLIGLKSLLNCEGEHVRICMTNGFNGTLSGTSLSANLCQKEEEDLVIGKDRMWCNTQQEVFQADSPSLNKVWVEVVCRQLVPHKLCL